MNRGQVTGFLWEEVDQVVYDQLTQGTLSSLRNAALISLGSDCLLRPGEIQAVEVAHYSQHLAVNRSAVAQFRGDPFRKCRGTTCVIFN